VSRKSRHEAPRTGTLQVTLPETGERRDLPASLAVLPLRDTVVYPRTTVPLFVRRATSVAAIDASVAESRILLALTQRRAEIDAPRREDLYQVGTVVRVLQVFRAADGTRRILVEGLATARVTAMTEDGGRLQAALEPWEEAATDEPEDPEPAAAVREAFRAYAALDRGVPAEALLGILAIAEPDALAWRVCAHLRLRAAVRQRLLECRQIARRLRLLQRVLDSEVAELRAGPAAPSEARAAADERGAACSGAEAATEIEALRRRCDEARMPRPVALRATRELDRLARLPSLSPEAAVSRHYIETLAELPWRRRTRDRTDGARVERILEEDHHGLEKVKERILEEIAVIRLSRRVRGPILCLVGPPGVGKTSLGRSIARALGRRFVQISLGGIGDEAEIRGHRRTYVGSLPGRIIQAMRRAGSVNPVMLLDEVDKLGRDHRGDPAAALLEVLDPEQNRAFHDHYLEVEYDLSRVLFLTTANVLDAIPEPLRDRMEVIRIPGYLETEKVEIARRFLLPRQLAATGLAPDDLEIPEATLVRLVRGYTREAGVRNLEREIARVCRRVARVKTGGGDPALRRACVGRRRTRGRLGIRIDPADLEKLLGVARHRHLEDDGAARVGIATGLAWTETGGELLTIEAGVLPGDGTLILTGQLGPTLRESAQAALSYIRSRARALGIEPDFYGRSDIHVHLPEGAIPKDGPSAGIAIALAMVSALTGAPTRGRLAASGEITLRGAVLPVGGLAEKLVAARRAGLGTILLPSRNACEVEELPDALRRGLTIRFVDSMDEVLALGLGSRPEAGAAHSFEDCARAA
jgi:ATP-dependent Lon protease